jgi:L-ascorbate metabolism protein UlaG (beta-lactamase superfamily)
MMPEDVVTAALKLSAKTLLPVHWGKFALALHAWDEPISRLVEESVKKGVRTATPMIGEAFYIDSEVATTNWWKGLA